MCVHEIWAYSECGCQVDHLIPCLNALNHDEVPRQPSPLRRCRRKTSLRGIRSPSPLRIIKNPAASASPVHLPPSPSPTDSEFSSHLENYYRGPSKAAPRECSVNHTVNKVFLEPICDDCFLKELGVDKRKSGQPPSVSVTTDDSLIWSSDVKIEVSEQHDVLPQTKILESNVEILIENAEQDELPAMKHQNDAVRHARQPSTFSATDADDEGSHRGRLRSRTKQLRRKGIDITREQLRISSRLPTLDRRTLEAFRDDIQKKAQDALLFEREENKKKKEQSPGKNFLTRFKEVENGSKGWVKGVVGDLKRSLSRNSRRARQDRDEKLRDQGARPTQQLASGVCTLRAVVDDNLTVCEDRHSTTENDEEEERCPGLDVPFSRSSPESDSSWQAHLSHDLLSRQASCKPLLTARSISGLHSTRSSEQRHASAPNWLAKSKSSGSLPLYSISERECRRHLLSMTSTAPSIPATASFTWSDPTTGQRLASIISSSEFDTTEHPWNSHFTPTFPEDDLEADATTINDDATSIAASSHHRATSIDNENSIHTADPASPPRPIRSLPHQHLHTDTPRPKKGLTMHPLTTPIRIATPLRPAFSPRTSSFTSPPMSSPARLGGWGMRHSPTAHFACIWERSLCKKGCGKVVDEDVKSCVCEEDEKIRDGCRSTAPVVRYVTALADEKVCEQCRVSCLAGV